MWKSSVFIDIVDCFRGYVTIRCYYVYCRLVSRLCNHPVLLFIL